MKVWEDKLDEKFESLTTIINNHTYGRHDATTITITTHPINLHTLIDTITYKFQQSNIRMQRIIKKLYTAAWNFRIKPPRHPHHTGSIRPSHLYHFKTPPGFLTNPQIYHQGPNNATHQWHPHYSPINFE